MAQPRVQSGHALAHLLLEPAIGHKQLIPLLEILRPSWQLSTKATTIETSLLRWAELQRHVDRARLAHLVQTLGDPHFARAAARRARELAAIGEPALMYLAALRPSGSRRRAVAARAIAADRYLGRSRRHGRSQRGLAGDSTRLAWRLLSARRRPGTRRAAAEELRFAAGHCRSSLIRPHLLTSAAAQNQAAAKSRIENRGGRSASAQRLGMNARTVRLLRVATTDASWSRQRQEASSEATARRRSLRQSASGISSGSVMIGNRVDYVLWLRRMVSRDALLPAIIAVTPVAIQLAFPKNDALSVAAAVILPVTAFFIRIYSGGRLIETNYCSDTMRSVQGVLLVLGLLPLLALDALVMAVPAAGLLAEDWQALAVLFAISFALTAIALYPGAEPVSGD